MEFHGVPWCIHGVSMEFHGVFMEFHGMSCSSTEFHVMPWNSLDYPWNLACFKIDCLTQPDHALKRKVSLTCAQTRVWLLRIEIVRGSIVCARLEGYIFGCCFAFYRCSFHLFCIYRHGLYCKLSPQSFGIIINSGRI